MLMNAKSLPYCDSMEHVSSTDSVFLGDEVLLSISSHHCYSLDIYVSLQFEKHTRLQKF